MKLLYVSVKQCSEPPRRPRERKMKRNENFKSEFGTTQSTTESFQYVLYACGRKIFISSGSSPPGVVRGCGQNAGKLEKKSKNELSQNNDVPFHLFQGLKDPAPVKWCLHSRHAMRMRLFYFSSSCHSGVWFQVCTYQAFPQTRFLELPQKHLLWEGLFTVISHKFVDLIKCDVIFYRKIKVVSSRVHGKGERETHQAALPDLLI